MLPLWLTPDFLIFALVLGAAVFWDLRNRRIPNSVTITGLILALFMSLILKDLPITAALSGAGLALILSFPLFALGGIGAGDAKLFTAVGAFVGPMGVLAVIIYGGLVGGALALADAARRGVVIPLLWNTKNMAVHLLTLGRHGERVTLATPGAQTLPYGVAIAIGGLAAWFLPLPGGAL
jgi:prepilin peptidase CpaA